MMIVHPGNDLRGTKLRRLGAAACGAWLAASLVAPAAALAQATTPNPGAWRPISYADLQRPSSVTATYADIWKDAIEDNNRAYRERGDMRFVTGNAPVTEAHFVIWSPAKSVVLSVLDTATGCTLKDVRVSVKATVKLCPLRIAVYEGVRLHTMDGGRTCFLELAKGTVYDPKRAASYAAYDISTKTVKTGLVIDHQAVDGCSQTIPLHP